ncbi:endolytic transglycosylase MltG [Actinomyces israelii]|uniref:endolytic transglycosylase MltG n=1 Tax=Actinomyces israelii TaxID=1659 RepID=UPI0023529DEA|nr:endolytic transglycosylase MltG [Actinomyces israelii]
MSQDDDFFTQLGIEPREPKRITGRRLDAARARRREERARRRRKRKRRLITALVLVLVLSAVGGVGWAAYKHTGIENFVTAPKDYEGAGEDEVTVTIPDGAVGKDIAQILVDADVVATARAFLEAYDDNANAINIQPGTYTLRHHMSGANAVALLLDPTSKSDHTLTVAEGATKAQVKDRLISVGHYTEAQVDEAFKAKDAIGLPDVAGGEVEGWLAPGTYDIEGGASVTDVVASMVSTTVSRLQDLGVSKADYQAVLIKASIVEREGTSEYYSKIARVIENRLKDTDGPTRGLLQMDSTVLYGVGRSGGIPTADQLADGNNPYNTYIHAGLPPTPIGSPGEETIKAVISPERGDWLYFVTVNLDTGETLFATTNEEQDENKKKFDAYCEEHPDKCYGSSATASPGAGSSPGPTPTAGG